MKDIHKDCKWQTRAEFDTPTNPLQALTEAFGRTSKDMGEDKLDAFLYGVIMGWEDESYEQLREKHNWSDENIKIQKMWHQNYIKAWNLFAENELKNSFSENES